MIVMSSGSNIGTVCGLANWTQSRKIILACQSRPKWRIVLCGFIYIHR